MGGLISCAELVPKCYSSPSQFRFRSVLGCLRQPGLIRNYPKVYEREFKATYSTFGTVTITVTLTRSIGLPAFAPVVMVFAEPSGEFYRDMTNLFSLSGHTHLDNFIVTPNLSPSIGTMQKLMPTLTPRLWRGRLPATNPNHRAVIFKPSRN
jgi:hypothetical protein